MPTEIQEYVYERDAYGRRGKLLEVITHREPEWTDDDRRQMRELELYERGLHKCGVHKDMLEDKSNLFMPEEWTCPVCAGMELRSRMLRKRDEGSVDRDSNGPQPSDGREIQMRLLVGEEAERVRAMLAEKQQRPAEADEGR